MSATTFSCTEKIISRALQRIAVFIAHTREEILLTEKFSNPTDNRLYRTDFTDYRLYRKLSIQILFSLVSNIRVELKIQLKIEVLSDFEMSDLSSSNLDKEETSDSEGELEEQNNQFEKKKKKEKIAQQRESVNLYGEETGNRASAADTSTSTATVEQERMRRKLQFFFMNPIEKWQAKRR